MLSLRVRRRRHKSEITNIGGGAKRYYPISADFSPLDRWRGLTRWEIIAISCLGVKDTVTKRRLVIVSMSPLLRDMIVALVNNHIASTLVAEFDNCAEAASQKRSIDASMSSADFVQRSGLGLILCRSIKI